jgi:hypothetical protein
MQGNDSFFLHSVQTGSGVHQAYCPMGTVVSSPEVKRPGREADHSPLSGAEVKNGGAISPLPHLSLCHSYKLIKHREVPEVSSEMWQTGGRKQIKNNDHRLNRRSDNNYFLIFYSAFMSMSSNTCFPENYVYYFFSYFGPSNDNLDLWFL